MTDDKTPAELHFDALIAERRKVGRKTYGKGLDPNDHYDWTQEALAEALDCCQYLATENLKLQNQLSEAKRAEQIANTNWMEALRAAQSNHEMLTHRVDRLENELSNVVERSG